jgi:phosphate/sulfate permease
MRAGVSNAVALHFVMLYGLTFGMTSTLFGLQHYPAAVALTLLMGAIAVLFVADTATPTSSKLSRAIGAIIGIGWSALIGLLVSNSWRAGVVLR